MADYAEKESIAWEGTDAVFFVQIPQRPGNVFDLFGLDAVIFIVGDAIRKSRLRCRGRGIALQFDYFADFFMGFFESS
eukprot:CAMPEP_0201643352 /NCGR_PEP_ID=MMETSP0493-20130528/28034_1 /ASSEMBLY_ACC=CAM_ASM_000838 /TAXON_ID=420259 /ORGANISM="Thalassiosira gravida, Strain GMp14c1" /LENGTH=77 /DNA_ID=CAMNT_0048117755 /DNA_START=730 /DNA_END=963 /DNA_ORIENTATION=+